MKGYLLYNSMADNERDFYTEKIQKYEEMRKKCCKLIRRIEFDTYTSYQKKIFEELYELLKDD